MTKLKSLNMTTTDIDIERATLAAAEDSTAQAYAAAAPEVHAAHQAVRSYSVAMYRALRARAPVEFAAWGAAHKAYRECSEATRKVAARACSASEAVLAAAAPREFDAWEVAHVLSRALSTAHKSQAPLHYAAWKAASDRCFAFTKEFGWKSAK